MTIDEPARGRSEGDGTTDGAQAADATAGGRPNDARARFRTDRVRDEPVTGDQAFDEAVLGLTRAVLGGLHSATAVAAGTLRFAKAMGRRPSAPPDGLRSYTHTTTGPGTDAPSRAPRPAGVVRLVPYAAFGLGLEAQRRSLRMAAAFGAKVGARAQAIGHGMSPRSVAARTRRELEIWGERGRAEWRLAEEESSAVTEAILQAVVDAVLERVDVDAVAARLDPNRVADRVDLDPLLERADLTTRTRQVLDDIDITGIIRDASGGMADETVDAFRAQNMRADQFVDRVVHRLLARGGEHRPGAGPGAPAETDGSGPGEHAASAPPGEAPPRRTV